MIERIKSSQLDPVLLQKHQSLYEQLNKIRATTSRSNACAFIMIILIAFSIAYPEDYQANVPFQSTGSLVSSLLLLHFSITIQNLIMYVIANLTVVVNRNSLMITKTDKKMQRELATG